MHSRQILDAFSKTADASPDRIPMSINTAATETAVSLFHVFPWRRFMRNMIPFEGFVVYRILQMPVKFRQIFLNILQPVMGPADDPTAGINEHCGRNIRCCLVKQILH